MQAAKPPSFWNRGWNPARMRTMACHSHVKQIFLIARTAVRTAAPLTSRRPDSPAPLLDALATWRSSHRLAEGSGGRPGPALTSCLIKRVKWRGLFLGPWAARRVSIARTGAGTGTAGTARTGLTTGPTAAPRHRRHSNNPRTPLARHWKKATKQKHDN